MNTRNAIVTAAMLSTAAIASASISEPADPGIFSPFDNAQVSFVWVSSEAGYTGELTLVDPSAELSPSAMWTNKSAIVGQVYEAPRLYSMGERIDFTYQVISGGLDTFSTAVASDWQQFQVDASNPLDVIVGVEDIRYPSGDMDHNDAVFHVVFTPATVPAPGAFALLGFGGVLCSRRRRQG